MFTKPAMNKVLWIAQWTLAAAFTLIGLVKLGLSEAHVAGLPAAGVVRAAAALQSGLALLVILPAALRIVPGVSAGAAAAMGVIAIIGLLAPSTAVGAGSAIDISLLAVATFVTWGRFAIAPLEAASESAA